MKNFFLEARASRNLAVGPSLPPLSPEFPRFFRSSQPEPFLPFDAFLLSDPNLRRLPRSCDPPPISFFLFSDGRSCGSRPPLFCLGLYSGLFFSPRRTFFIAFPFYSVFKEISFEFPDSRPLLRRLLFLDTFPYFFFPPPTPFQSLCGSFLKSPHGVVLLSRPYTILTPYVRPAPPLFSYTRPRGSPCSTLSLISA